MARKKQFASQVSGRDMLTLSAKHKRLLVVTVECWPGLGLDSE